MIAVKKHLEYESVNYGMTYFFVFFVKIRRKTFGGEKRVEHVILAITQTKLTNDS